MSETARSLTYRGLLKRGATPDTVEALVRDDWGFSLVVTGQRVPGGYQLTVVSGPVPAEFVVPLLDDAG